MLYTHTIRFVHFVDCSCNCAGFDTGTSRLIWKSNTFTKYIKLTNYMQLNFKFSRQECNFFRTSNYLGIWIVHYFGLTETHLYNTIWHTLEHHCNIRYPRTRRAAPEVTRWLEWRSSDPDAAARYVTQGCGFLAFMGVWEKENEGVFSFVSRVAKKYEDTLTEIEKILKLFCLERIAFSTWKFFNQGVLCRRLRCRKFFCTGALGQKSKAWWFETLGV